MSYVYDTTGKTVQVTASSTARALHDDIQTVFAGSTYMQYLIPDSGSIKDTLYIFQNGWTFLDTTSSGYMKTGGWQFANGNDKWTNAKTISGDTFTGIQLYYNQTGTPTNFGATGLIDALIKVRTGGTDVASQAYTVYQRTFQKKYSEFAVTASSGGVDTIPLTVSADQYLTLSANTIDGPVVTMTIASPAVVTLNSHGFSAGQTLIFKTSGALPTGVTAGTTYYVIATGLASNTFEFSATLGGSAVNTSGTQSGTHQVNGYTDLTSAWATIYRSAFDGASTTQYTLNGAHNNSTTTITVNESVDASVPSTGKLSIGNSISQETISYTGKTTHTFTGCTRGAYRTTAGTYVGNENLSTATAQYTVQIKTTNSARTLSQIYNWIQFQLTKSTDIDLLAGSHIGKITSSLVTYTGSLATNQGVWVEGFAAADGNSITYTDQTSTVHTPPLTVAVAVNFDAAIASASGQVSVFVLDGTYTDATYTPAHISSTLLNTAASGTSASTSLTYSSDLPVRVLVRAPGYQQFSLYTTITSAGLSVTAQNPVDSAY